MRPLTREQTRLNRNPKPLFSAALLLLVLCGVLLGQLGAPMTVVEGDPIKINTGG